MNANTHLSINADLCGTPVALEPGYSKVRMLALPVMASDERGLVHGGFVFGMADYAAMLAVNDPLVVLGSAQTSFVKPVAVGRQLEAEARVLEENGRKRSVEVTVRDGETVVLTGSFLCFVLDKHVLGE